MAADVLSQPFTYGAVVNTALLALPGPLNGSVLDVGCGVGAWADALRRAGARQLTGIEPSASAAADASARYDQVLSDPIEQLGATA